VARNVRKVARKLGARVVSKVPEAGGGAFGAARLAAALKSRLVPSVGDRPGRPSDPSWVNRPKVPMSDATLARLEALGKRLSTPDRKLSPMQVAAQLLESAVEQVSGDVKFTVS
jgi:hypothetical protein